MAVCAWIVVTVVGLATVVQAIEAWWKPTPPTVVHVPVYVERPTVPMLPSAPLERKVRGL